LWQALELSASFYSYSKLFIHSLSARYPHKALYPQLVLFNWNIFILAYTSLKLY
jgi:hypothetical protein